MLSQEDLNDYLTNFPKETQKVVKDIYNELSNLPEDEKRTLCISTELVFCAHKLTQDMENISYIANMGMAQGKWYTLSGVPCESCHGLGINRGAI